METLKNDRQETQSFLQELIAKHGDGSVVERNEIFKFIEGKNLESFLEDIVSLGFVIHGSPNFFEEVKPHKAKDDKGTPENEHFAIYATDLPAIAIYMSIVSGDKISKQQKSIHWGAGVRLVDNKRVPYFSADQDLSSVMDSGYLYLFKREDFSPVSDHELEEQFVSHEPLKPILVIRTEPSDFNYPIDPKIIA